MSRIEVHKIRRKAGNLRKMEHVKLGVESIPRKGWIILAQDPKFSIIAEPGIGRGQRGHVADQTQILMHWIQLVREAPAIDMHKNTKSICPPLNIQSGKC